MSSTASAELRQFPRRAVGNSQLLTADFLAASGATHHSIVLNLSEGGAAVQLLGASPSTSVSKLHLSLPTSDTPIETAGEIVWLAPGGRAGVQFRDTSPRAIDSIRNWLTTQPEQDFSPPPELDEIAPEMGAFGVALRAILECAITRTRATSGAIALGDRTSMSCCASIGAAPPVGAVLQADDAGLSGFCLQTGKDVFCPDTRLDNRVDQNVAESLNIRSAAFILIRVSREIAGILELFSNEPNAFTPELTRALLKRLLPFLSAAIQERELATRLPVEVVESVPVHRLANFVEPSLERASPAEAPVEESSEATVEQSIEPNFALQPQPITFFSRSAIVVVGIVLFLTLLGWYMAEHIYAARTRSAVASKVVSGTANTGSANAAFTPNVLKQKVGSSFSVDVVLNNAHDVSSVPMEIMHDPKMLKFVSVSSGDLIGPAGMIVHREQKGKVQVTASAAPSTGISGSGVVCTLVFLAKAPGRSTVHIGQIALKDRSSRPIPVQSSDATVTISR